MKTLLSMPFSRKRKGITNYRKRLMLLRSGKPRLVVRKTKKAVIAQLSTYDQKGDHTLATATCAHLKKLNWQLSCKNIAASYLIGLLIGKKALELGVKEAILDIGMQTATKGSKVFAVAKGAIDAGLTVPCSQDVLPNKDRLVGKHIAQYAIAAKGTQFSKSKGAATITDLVEEVKAVILKDAKDARQQAK